MDDQVVEALRVAGSETVAASRETGIQAGALLADPQTRFLGPTFQEWFDAGERVATPRRSAGIAGLVR